MARDKILLRVYGIWDSMGIFREFLGYYGILWDSLKFIYKERVFNQFKSIADKLVRKLQLCILVNLVRKKIAKFGGLKPFGMFLSKISQTLLCPMKNWSKIKHLKLH